MVLIQSWSRAWSGKAEPPKRLCDEGIDGVIFKSASSESRGKQILEIMVTGLESVVTSKFGW